MAKIFGMLFRVMTLTIYIKVKVIEGPFLYIITLVSSPSSFCKESLLMFFSSSLFKSVEGTNIFEVLG